MERHLAVKAKGCKGKKVFLLLKMQSVQLKPLFHRHAEQIGIFFQWNQSINLAVRKIKGAKWSQTHKVWYMPLNQTAYDQIKTVLTPLAAIDNHALKEYLEKRKQINSTCITPEKESGLESGSIVIKRSPVLKLSAVNPEALNRFVQQLKLKAYSTSTIKTYRSGFLQLLEILKNKPVHELTRDDLKRYMVYAMEKQGINENTAHSHLNALKFYFEQVLGREKFFWEIPRPRKPLTLPKVLNRPLA